MSSGSAMASSHDCWKKEIDPTTEKIYSSEQAWQFHVDYWQKKNKIIPNPFQLARAYGLYKSNKKTATQLKNDKMAHCYMGCRIAQDVDFRTAKYLAWLKEEKDITDCNPNSHFEAKDYEATLIGARIPKGNYPNCIQQCKLKLVQGSF